MFPDRRALWNAPRLEGHALLKQRNSYSLNKLYYFYSNIAEILFYVDAIKIIRRLLFI
jgi:hypothetical protein